jgi:hypothetical protein
MPSFSITRLERASPADFDAGREVCDETGHVQSNEADESASQCDPNLDRFLSAIDRPEKTPKLHHRRIRVQARERLPVRWTPRPRDEPLGFETSDHSRLGIKDSVIARSWRGFLGGKKAIEEVERRFVDVVLHLDSIAELHRWLVLHFIGRPLR